MLDVLTVNLWGTNGPVRERLSALAEYLRDHRPDVVALQEVQRWHGTTQAHHLAKQAGYAAAHHTRTGRRLRRGEGLAVLTAEDSRPVATVALPSDLSDHPRAVQLVDAAIGDRVLRVANTHLAWRLQAGDRRVTQTTAIRDELAAWTGPALVAGDLNDVPGSPPLRVLSQAGFADALALAGAAERPTFDPANPYLWQRELANRRVDHLLVRGLHASQAAVVLTGEDGPIVSDHFAVWARLALPDG